ncbi:hypothetical protein [Thiocapsa sp.]|uniref:hypothetical protein n=1 Tax=Thiocapsa sp. TaxID=2024551 RepID=UPI0025EC35FC|nr:hypothetical protein [Thiocapsa sp.]
MRTTAKILVAISLSAGAVSSALAQQDFGWDVAWGTAQPVPLSPWATALLGLLLVAATYAFLHKRSKQGGVALIAAGAIFGSTYLTQESWAVAYDLTISTASGSEFVSCGILDIGSTQQEANGPVDLVVGTTLQEGVVLRRVESSFPVLESSEEAPKPTALAEQCSVGLRVTPDAPCTLPCYPG